MKLFFKLCSAIVFSSLITSSSEARVWTQKSTGKSIEGDFQSQDETHVKILIKRKTFNLEKNNLSEKDQSYLKGLEAAKHEKPSIKKHEEPHCEVATWYSYLPASYKKTGSKHPVCFIYHYGGRTKDVVQNFIPSADELGWVIIGIDAYSNNRIKESNGFTATAKDSEIIYKKAFKTFNINSSKVVFSGVSGGAWWSFVSSRTFNKRTAGIISQAGWMSNQYNYTYPRRMAVAMINGNSDKDAIRFEKPDGDVLTKKFRASVKVFRFDGGHVNSPAASCLEAAKWIHKTKKF